MNGAYTDWFDIRRGVGQECVASPCLFNLLMDSCLYDLKEYECRLRMDELSVECLLYADDRKSLLCRRAGCRRCGQQECKALSSIDCNKRCASRYGRVTRATRMRLARLRTGELTSVA
ncbi:hypothetical protein EVAR_59377_1 [Eumeta japonica]|uniref:Reverse transcriptase domain-containing protein n=1 Tax=Eumeta variegata TaxID=151549 RepID=A0A4C1ZYN6_EUMVA|nr:hypothetical protein EVAR_59377_1 [Eumeta japonica]